MQSRPFVAVQDVQVRFRGDEYLINSRSREMTVRMCVYLYKFQLSSFRCNMQCRLAIFLSHVQIHSTRNQHLQQLLCPFNVSLRVLPARLLSIRYLQPYAMLSIHLFEWHRHQHPDQSMPTRIRLAAELEVKMDAPARHLFLLESLPDAEASVLCDPLLLWSHSQRSVPVDDTISLYHSGRVSKRSLALMTSAFPDFAALCKGVFLLLLRKLTSAPFFKRTYGAPFDITMSKSEMHMCSTP